MGGALSFKCGTTQVEDLQESKSVGVVVTSETNLDTLSARSYGDLKSDRSFGLETDSNREWDDLDEVCYEPVSESDLTILVGTAHFRVHKSILAMTCGEMRRRFAAKSEKEKKIVLRPSELRRTEKLDWNNKGQPAVIVKQFLDELYNLEEKTTITKDSCAKVMELATQLDCPTVERRCVPFVENNGDFVLERLATAAQAGNFAMMEVLFQALQADYTKHYAAVKPDRLTKLLAELSPTIVAHITAAGRDDKQKGLDLGLLEACYSLGPGDSCKLVPEKDGNGVRNDGDRLKQEGNWCTILDATRTKLLIREDFTSKDVWIRRDSPRILKPRQSQGEVRDDGKTRLYGFAPLRDLILNLDGTRFHVHRAILAWFSPVLRDALAQDPNAKDLNLTGKSGHTEETLSSLLAEIYHATPASFKTVQDKASSIYIMMRF